MVSLLLPGCECLGYPDYVAITLNKVITPDPNTIIDDEFLGFVCTD